MTMLLRMMRLGAHVSAAGGVGKSPANAEAIAAECMQVFTRSQRRWVSPRLLKKDILEYKAELDRCGISPVLAHASYLINLAANDGDIRRKSLQSFVDEIKRAQTLDIGILVIHPGAHVGAGIESGISKVAKNIDRCLDSTGPSGPRIALETTAGQGTVIGAELSQIRDIIGSSTYPERLGLCVDSCHIHAAGYDIRTVESYETTLESLDQIIGLDKVCSWHLNDSKHDLGSRKDRHAELGEGTIGLEPLRRIVHDARFADIAGILETPGGPTAWIKELDVLRASSLGE